MAIHQRMWIQSMFQTSTHYKHSHYRHTTGTMYGLMHYHIAFFSERSSDKMIRRTINGVQNEQEERKSTQYTLNKQNTTK